MMSQNKCKIYKTLMLHFLIQYLFSIAYQEYYLNLYYFHSCNYHYSNYRLVIIALIISFFNWLIFDFKIQYTKAIKFRPKFKIYWNNRFLIAKFTFQHFTLKIQQLTCFMKVSILHKRKVPYFLENTQTYS